MFEISTHAEFAATHALRFADGTMEPVHAHDWPVRITVAAETLDEIECVMDFHDLQALLESIISPWRNRHLNEVDPFCPPQSVNPTAERVAWWIGERLVASLPRRVRVVKVTVGEAPGCYATYRA